MHSSYNTEHYIKQVYYVTRTKHDYASSKCTFKWDTSVTGHNQWAVGLPQRNERPPTNANSTVAMYTQNARKDLYWGKQISARRITFIQQNKRVNTGIALQT
jgi:hypothetical protein